MDSSELHHYISTSTQSMNDGYADESMTDIILSDYQLLDSPSLCPTTTSEFSRCHQEQQQPQQHHHNNTKNQQKNENGSGGIFEYFSVVVPPYVQNVFILLGLYYQSFAIIAVICFIQSSIVQNYRFNVIGFKWNPHTSSSSYNSVSHHHHHHNATATAVVTNNRGSSTQGPPSDDTLTNIEHYYDDNCHQPYYSRMDLRQSSTRDFNVTKLNGNMKKSASDEWGLFAEFD